jgi:GNAT superfamily N-acetyltransferase
VSPIALDAAALRARRAEFATLLLETVAEGAEVSFLHPLAPARAERFWLDVAEAVEAGRSVIFASDDAVGLIGTVQLEPVASETAPRLALVSKLMTRRDARGRGVATALLAALQAAALTRGRDILLLDTVPGSDAHRLYGRLGWQLLGTIEGGAVDGWGRVCDNAMLTKRLAA